jgi:glycine dehydrogenase subunit 2
MQRLQPLIYELSSPGRTACSLPELDVPGTAATLLPGDCLRSQAPSLPEVSEVDVVRHFTGLSQLNHGVDTGFYPLGSCTMKYNPKINEDLSRLGGFANLHPLAPEEASQGALQLMHEMQQYLAEITGMDAVTLQPAAGAHGELTGLMLIRAYHEQRGERRTKVIVPDSAHGTNPASASINGFTIVQVKSNERGGVDIDALKAVLDNEVACLMLTNPNTLGLFDENIDVIADLVHDAGGLLYYDGANANAIMGYARPGDAGFDVIHLNLHKTFATPHGGGGPGSGPVGCKAPLTQFLPVPVVVKRDDGYHLEYDRPDSIGRVKAFYANFGVVVKAYAYIREMGPDGLRHASEDAVLNANYLAARLKEKYHLVYDRLCKHEFVLSADWQKKATGVRTLDIAKRLLDFGFHPPTVYFPLIVDECLMIEPTETESRETLDSFVEALLQIATEAAEQPDQVKSAPHDTVVGRLDESRAARQPVLRWRPTGA